MIYITGDCHGDFQRFDTEIFPEQKEMTKDDYCIITGDFGGIWDQGKEGGLEKRILNWLEAKPFTTLFVDGNHENFDRLEVYPLKEWHGGKVHTIRPSVFHLMRGQVFIIDGASFFTFGGARSHDIDGGILDPDAPDYEIKKRKYDRNDISYRVNHISWWERELPSMEELEEGKRNLALHGNKVDFIVTHCAASSTQAIVGGSHYKPDLLTAYFEEIRQSIDFKKWFFGHYHDNRNISPKEILIYDEIIRIR